MLAEFRQIFKQHICCVFVANVKKETIMPAYTPKKNIMKKLQHHNKLVRDYIVENLEKKNIECDYRALDAAELVQELKKKIVEEANEVLAASEINELLVELADVQEVLDALCAKHDITKDMLW